MSEFTINIPSDVKLIMDKLEDAGYEAYVVGGCVRDSVLGLEPKDWDLTTSAKPEEIKAVFKDYSLVEIGEQHGTIGVILDGVAYEITTYRIDGNYSDSRHPESVSFTDNLELDLSRRDFTVNAVAYSEKRGIVDPFNGMSDLRYNALRCVGNPDERFTEDPLRIMRALRFASVYNLSIEGNTAFSIVRNRLLLSKISVERIASELTKTLCGQSINFILRRYKDIFSVFLPEIVATFDCEQNNPHHNKSVWRHITASVSNIEPNPLLRVVMLLHDIGKPLALRTDSNGVDHFKGHNHFSAVLAKSALERLKFPTRFIEDTVTLIEYHDVRFNGSGRQIKHVMNKIGTENFARLMKIQRADVLAQSRYMRETKLLNIDNAEKEFNSILESGECFQLKNLGINGSDLIHLGITEGKEIGSILELLLDAVIDGTIENNSVELKKLALQIHRMKKEP